MPHSAAHANRQSTSDAPQTIWCDQCEKDLPRDRFSETALQKLMASIREAEVRNGWVDGKWVGLKKNKGEMKNKKAKYIPVCIKCTPKQVEFITCEICKEVKRLTEYSKAQRRMAAKDNGARCLKCVVLREDLDWVQNDEDGVIRYEMEEDEFELNGENQRSTLFLPPI
ncbi:hypothetical protein HDV00_010068 [Rhizophlyctis rosea]|nr:hypothetical protein HDV00_010068 [Rhizophlyctis rosea]